MAGPLLRLRGLWGTALSEYGMVFVLVGLCAYYTWATWGVQYARGADAADEIIRGLPTSAARGVLVAAHEGHDAEDFAAAAVEQLKKMNVPVRAVVRGTPADLRAKLDEHKGTVQVLVATREVSQWRLVQNLGETVTVIAPKPRAGSDFLTRSNLAAIEGRVAVIAIIGIGMTLVILTGGIDLSVGSLIALAAVLATRLIKDWAGGFDAGAVGMTLCCAAAVAACALVGLFSGTMVTLFRVPPFIVTLAVMLMAIGLAYELSNGESINALPQSFTWLGRGSAVGGLPNTLLLVVILYAVAAVAMSRTVAGRWLYAIGGNREAAFYAGVPVRRVTCAAYVIAAALAGLGGVVEASRLKSGSPTYGLMAELSVIAAVVVGGASLTGRRGTVFGTLGGALSIAVIENGMNLTRVGPYRQKVVLGAVILGAVLADRLRSRRPA